MKIAIIGNGAIGEPHKKFLLRTENELLVVDKNDERANSTLTNAAQYADTFIISLPSNGLPGGDLDTKTIEQTIEFLAIAQQPDRTREVIIRSTVPVGFTRKMQEKHPGINFYFVPEFLTQKTADQDFNFNQRLIVGVMEKSEAQEKAIEKMSKIFPAAGKIFACDFEVAELTKLATNSFYATKVLFFNELNKYCERRGIKYAEIKFLLSFDPRIGSEPNDNQGRDVHMRIAQDGLPGFGGKCLPKDVAQLAKLYCDAKVGMGLLEYVDGLNKLLRTTTNQKTENKNTKTKTTKPAQKPAARA